MEMNYLQYVITLFNQYGYTILLFALILELIALPLPGEALMTYCGYIIYQHKMSWSISILVSTLGVGIGITLSYFIGKVVGKAFFEKHGHYIHMDKNRLDNISRWFEKYGNKLLIIAYFIPGVRHITGYFSGISKVSYGKFAVNAYLGAIIWTSTFISLGKALGANWEIYHNLLKKYLLIGSLIISVIIIIIFLYKTHKQRIYNLIIKILNNSLKIFHSLGRLKIVITGIAASFLGAEAISNILKIVFHRVGPSGIFYTFPSGESFMTVVTYGFLSYMIIKYSNHDWVNYLALCMCLSINLFIGVSMIYLNLQYPSDIIAGYEFGAVWLSLSIILLEIYRVLPNL